MLLEQLMDWTTFYLGTAGAAATLMGLLFIGVQFRLGELRNEPVSRWRFIARSTFTMYVLLFILPMSFLIPNLGNTGHASFIFIVVIFCTVRALRHGFPSGTAFTNEANESWKPPGYLLDL